MITPRWPLFGIKLVRSKFFGQACGFEVDYQLEYGDIFDGDPTDGREPIGRLYRRLIFGIEYRQLPDKGLAWFLPVG